MPFGNSNFFTGSYLGKDRMGHTTPDAEGSEILRPFLPLAYPAPYLPIKRQDDGHPIRGGVVLSSQQLVGQDKSGALVPAGLFCGNQGTIASGADYCALVYGAADVGVTYNAKTGNKVAAAGEFALLACPSDAVAGAITLGDGTSITIAAGDITFALACNLFPAGKVVPIGVTIRNVFQYLGGVLNISATNGMSFTLDPNTPMGMQYTNYMHEPATAIQTAMMIKVPWIGATPTTLTTLASGDGVTGYTQTAYGRSFVHYTGALTYGTGVVASSFRGPDAGNYSVFNPAKHSALDLIGKVVGVEALYPVRDYADRVRTQFNRALGGPIADPNPNSIRMGGSSTSGLPYQVSLATDNLFQLAIQQGKTVRPEYGTYAWILLNTQS